MKYRFYLPVVGLLLLQLLIRTHNITIQNPYIDEGFHIRRAGFIYDFEFHPARVSHGKLLVYFWLGLFETDRLHVLASSRLSIGLISLVTGATLYQLGKTMHSRTTGLLALLLYIFCPIALFYERMAMADPLATVLATLTVWRSLVLVKRPTLKEGALIGLLVGLAVMAKLTMGLLPLLPALAALIFFPWRRGLKSIVQQINEWSKIYLPPITTAAIAALFLWLPILVPAALALNTEEPFKLVNAYNLRVNAEESQDRFTPLEYIQQIRAEMDDFFTEHLLLFVGGIFIVTFFLQPTRNHLYILLWFAVFIVPSILGARLATARYFMPVSAPLMFALAYTITNLWESPRPHFLRWGQKILALAGFSAAGIWLFAHAIPFASTDLTQPNQLHFSETNYTEYQSGFLTADDAERHAADALNAMNPAPKHIIANWNLCHMLYFYTRREVPCLRLDYTRQDLAAFVKNLPEGESGYLILSGYRPFFQQLDGLGWQELARFKHDHIRSDYWDVQIWRLWKTAYSD